MAIQTYSRKLDGSKQLSANFKVSEFACQDGSDQILICDSLVKILQWVRDHFGQPVTITSAYRTKPHNAKVGGASNSQHLLGMAADIVVAGTAPLSVAQYAESVMINGGVGYYPAGEGSFVHIDTRQSKYRWQQQNGRSVTVSSFGGSAGKSLAQQVQDKAGLDDNTMAYLAEYKYGPQLLEKLARAMQS